MMKSLHFFLTLVVVLMIGAVATFAQDIGGMYYKNTTNAVAVVKPGPGTPAITMANVYFTTTGSTLYKRYWASLDTKLSMTNSVTVSNLVMIVDNTETNGAVPKLGGYTITTNDWLIMGGSADWVLRRVHSFDGTVNATTSRLGKVTLARVNFRLTATVAAVASNDYVYLVKSTDVISATMTTARDNMYSHGIGYNEMPFAVSSFHTGVMGEVSGTYEYWKHGSK